MVGIGARADVGRPISLLTAPLTFATLEVEVVRQRRASPPDRESRSPGEPRPSVRNLRAIAACDTAEGLGTLRSPVS
ncbi:hypothetical protein [Baaleninema simplex]|uniref:hypothetical protein n=1 Tax=Baaleninema simplex TaxID=2862350 RepID=UPI0011818AAA|nr:hypothetical protein [Baaleninema simplex]